MNGTKLRELRQTTGMTQKEFSKFLDIPLSTLTKWEQDINKPPYYVFKMINLLFPNAKKDLIKIEGPDNKIFYFDDSTKEVMDSKGNIIKVNADLNEVNRHNLGIYLNESFADLYKIQDRLNRDCELDKIEGIIW